MRCQVAGPVIPSLGGIGIGFTVPSGRCFCAALAPIALFNNLMANPAIEGAPLCRHKRARLALSYGRTVHCNHPLYRLFDTNPGRPDSACGRPHRFSGLPFRHSHPVIGAVLAPDVLHGHHPGERRKKKARWRLFRAFRSEPIKNARNIMVSD